MKVAVMYSGGKDSTQAIKWCLDNKHEIVTLIAVKPKDTEAYLYHYATVEWTPLSAEAMGMPLVLLKTDKTNPDQEANELEKVFKRIKADAVVLGGVGLQKTQIKAIEKVAKKFKINVLVPYENKDHYELIKDAINSGFDIRITQVAVDGLDGNWLGRKLDLSALEELKKLSENFGFHIGAEGGHYDSFVVDAPMFKKKIEFVSSKKVWDNKTNSGYLEVEEAKLVPK